MAIFSHLLHWYQLQNALEYLKAKTILNTQFPSYAVTIESSLSGNTNYHYYLYADGSHPSLWGMAQHWIQIPESAEQLLRPFLSIMQGLAQELSLLIIYIPLKPMEIWIYTPMAQGLYMCSQMALWLQIQALQAVLNAYEYTMFSITFSGPFSQVATISAVRVGRICTITFPIIQATLTASACLTSPLPNPFIPVASAMLSICWKGHFHESWIVLCWYIWKYDICFWFDKFDIFGHGTCWPILILDQLGHILLMQPRTLFFWL